MLVWVHNVICKHFGNGARGVSFLFYFFVYGDSRVHTVLRLGKYYLNCQDLTVVLRYPWNSDSPDLNKKFPIFCSTFWNSRQ